MKLNKLFFILFAVSLSLGSTSCSDDDDDNYSAGDIVGTWLMTADKTRVTTNNGKATELVNKFLSQNDNETETVYIFNEEGTFIEKEGLSKPNSVSGTYRVKGNKINLRYGENDHEQEAVISSLSSNVLMLSSNIDLNISLMEYLTEKAEFGSVSIEMLKKKFEAASIDISTITVKQLKVTETLEKVITNN